jgi:hypothetical protein
MDMDEGGCDEGRLYHVYIRSRLTGRYLAGDIIWHEECVFVDEIKRDDFLLTRSVAMRLLLTVAKDMYPRLGVYGDCGFIEYVHLDRWLNDRCQNDGGQWLFGFLNRVVRSFS